MDETVENSESLDLENRSESDLRRAIEAVLLVSTEPAPEILIAEIVAAPVSDVAHLCATIRQDLVDSHSGIELAHVAGGWRYQTCRDMAPYMERFALSGHSLKISAAALETLSIIAYKQPVSRSQMSAIRGVSVDGVIKTLLQRGYIEETGVDEGPGRANLYGTTSFFLEQVGLASLDELPSLGEFVPSAEVLEILEKTLTGEQEPSLDPDLENSSDSVEIDLRDKGEDIDLTDTAQVSEYVDES